MRGADRQQHQQLQKNNYPSKEHIHIQYIMCHKYLGLLKSKEHKQKVYHSKSTPATYIGKGHILTRNIQLFQVDTFCV
uniref:Ovule protein n=1 Tax=Strongyloides venezuelensis TaxID=75913 RepID=A0A0K0EZD8_STRVS